MRTCSFYEAGLHEVDFKTDWEGVRRIINEWVEDKTEKKIRDLIPSGVIDELPRLVLTNAIYFKGTWICPFQEENTKDDLFTLLSGERVKVSMMHQTDDFRYKDVSGETALMKVRQGDIVKLLLDYGADPNLTDKDGRTALFGAVELRDAEKLKLLLERGVDVGVQDKEGKTALMLAEERGWGDLFESHGDNIERV